MKSGKSFYIYQLTVEHLRNCGLKAKQHILDFINSILLNIYYMSCQQIKLGLSTPIYKRKKKPIWLSSSYRRITVPPILGALIDYYIDLKAEAIFRPSQSPDQLGFTVGVSVRDGPWTRNWPALVSLSTASLTSHQLRGPFKSESSTLTENVEIF